MAETRRAHRHTHDRHNRVVHVETLPDDYKSTSRFRIVEMFCEGLTVDQVADQLGLDPGHVMTRFGKLRLNAKLPHNPEDFPTNREKIMQNVHAWYEFHAKLAALQVEYFGRLHRFDDGELNG